MNVRVFKKFVFAIGITGCILGSVCQSDIVQAETSKESSYQEVKKDGRLYIFASHGRKADFEKTGELGAGIIKVGYGENGETVVFDSDEAVVEYESRIIKGILEKVDVIVYKEVKIDGRLYVFTSPTRMASFEKSGELGTGIIKIGYGVNGETVVFDSDEAVKEYNNRHPLKQTEN